MENIGIAWKWHFKGPGISYLGSPLQNFKLVEEPLKAKSVLKSTFIRIYSAKSHSCQALFSSKLDGIVLISRDSMMPFDSILKAKSNKVERYH